ncbi:MAG: CBS domain-containing protein [Alphaproteobacteria bacterium]
MTVAQILADKGRDVATVAHKSTLADATSTLAKRSIGALVVSDDAGRIAGIISERDIVRALHAGGGEALSSAVESVMTKEVVTCAEAETINDVMGRMTRGRFRHLPVVDDQGRLDGIISIGDVVRVRIEQVEKEAEELRSYIATA